MPASGIAMADTEERLRRLESQVSYLSSDLKVLRTLVDHDYASALNKIRYVTEKVLHKLCKGSDISWGKGEPTVENMIGPLIARKVIPKNVAIHVRTIQTNASPGSHYQETPLSITHVHVAQMALLDFLEWYCQQDIGAAEAVSEANTGADVESRSPRTAKRRWVVWSAVTGCILLVLVLVSVVALDSGTGVDSEEEKVGGIEEIKAAVRKSMPSIKACYLAELEKNEDIGGKLVFSIKLDEDAVVDEIKVSTDELGSAAVAVCIMSKLKEVKYPKSVAGDSITYPFLLLPTRTLAILPFDNMTGDKNLEWLRNGITEVLMTKLGQLSRIVLVDRLKLDGIMSEKALGQKETIDQAAAVNTGRLAGAKLVITGAYQRAGARTRFTARLVDVETGKVKRTAEVTGKLDDVFELQDELAAKLAKIMNVRPSPKTDAALALRISRSVPLLELMGRASNALSGVGEPKSYKKAETLYRQVISKDPNIPEAYVGLARSLWITKTEESEKEVQRALKKAIELRPDYYEAMTLLGFNLWINGKAEDAFELQKRALALKPDYALGYYGLAIGYASRGKADEAIAMCKQAMELDLRDSEFVTQYGQLIAIFKRDFNGALQYTGEATKMANAGEWNFITHAYVQMMAGDATGCLKSVEAGRKVRTPANVKRYAEQSLGMEAACLVKSGNLDAARALLERVPMEGQARRILEKKWPEETPAFVRIFWNDVVDALEPILPHLKKE